MNVSAYSGSRHSFAPVHVASNKRGSQGIERSEDASHNPKEGQQEQVHGGWNFGAGLQQKQVSGGAPPQQDNGCAQNSGAGSKQQVSGGSGPQQQVHGGGQNSGAGPQQQGNGGGQNSGAGPQQQGTGGGQNSGATPQQGTGGGQNSGATPQQQVNGGQSAGAPQPAAPPQPPAMAPSGAVPTRTKHFTPAPIPAPSGITYSYNDFALTQPSDPPTSDSTGGSSFQQTL